MLQRYRAVFRAPGAAAFCAASFVLRMPNAIYPLAIILTISAQDGRYSFAGVLSTCFVFGYAAGSPVLSRLVDRYGQRRLLLPCAGIHALGVGMFILLLHAHAPGSLLVLPAMLFGFSNISITALVRARWIHLYDGCPELATALSVESVLDEVIFVVCPPLATLLATRTEPVLVLYLCVAVVVGGSLWLAGLRATEPPVHPEDATQHVSALRTRGLVAVLPVSVAIGAVFAAVEVSIIAFCGQHGHRSLSGLVLAAAAVGSAAAGIAYGAVEWRSDVLHQFRVIALVFAALPFVLFAATSVPVLAAVGFVLGIGTAPTVITLFAMIQQLVPVRAVTEGLAWVSSGFNVGYGLGAALAGVVADQHGARTAFLVAVSASVLAGVLAVSVRVRLDDPATPAPHRAAGGGTPVGAPPPVGRISDI